ncbi:MAG: hypothetical protein FRX49_10858 [Trebouxia sp. A1-2]|nr:MAG: hypothetical protein FRX49_10858 [Trebouxia sp. A1-2]
MTLREQDDLILLVRSSRSMSSVVVYLESGQATDTLKEFVRHFCLQQSVLLPELPREHENGSYRLYVPPAEDASPDGDALQAFEWASNPPGMVVRRMTEQSCCISVPFVCQLPGKTKLKRRAAVNNWRRSFSASKSLQAKELLPVALPTDQKALAFIADAVAEHNRKLANSQAKASGKPGVLLDNSQTFSGDASPVSEDADLFRQRMKMLQAVRAQAQAIVSMQATDHACLLYQDYLQAFRIQQQAQQGNRRPRCFPEHDIRFAFEEGGMIFGVNRPGADRSGIPLWTGVNLPVVDEEDMEALGADQLYDAADCAQLLTHTATVEKTQRPLSSLWPRPASFFHMSSPQNVTLDRTCAFPAPGQEVSRDTLRSLEDALAECNSPEMIAVQWRSRPQRFAVRLSQLRELGLLPQAKPSGVDANAARPVPGADSGSSPGGSSGLKMDHSEAASSAPGPSPPWPTPAQLKQTLAAFGRAQAEENAHTLAAREAFGALISKMHVAELKSKPPALPKSAATGHAFVPATSRVMTLAEAAAMTEQLRCSEQAVNQEVVEKVRQRHQEAAAASKHALKSSLYWKGAIGRAHSNLRRSALQQVHQANRDAKHGLVQMGHGRQAKGKQQHHDRQLMSNYHGQLNMLKAYTLRTDMQHREKLATEAAWAAVLEEREAEAERQARILHQQQAAQRAKQVAGEEVRAIPVLAEKKRLHILRELQDLVDTRRNEEIDSLERTAPPGGVWGSQQQPPWWTVLPLTMVGSVSDPEVSNLITTVNDSAFWAGREGQHHINLAAQAQHAANSHGGVKTSGFQFAGLTKPSGLA